MEEGHTDIYIPGALGTVFALGVAIPGAIPLADALKSALSPEFQGVVSPEAVDKGLAFTLAAGGVYAAYKVIRAGYHSGGFVGGFFVPPLTAGAFFAGLEVGVQFFGNPVLDSTTDQIELNHTDHNNSSEANILPNGQKITFG